MAEQTYTTILKVDTQQSETTVKDLKNEISSLRKKIDESKISDENLAKVEADLIQKKKLLKEVTSRGAEALRTASKSADGSKQSYNDLASSLSEMKRAWKATTDEVTRNELGAKILKTNNALKKMDASIGNYQRNVGDYANQMKQAFTSVAGGAISMIAPINGINVAFTALSANPIGAVLGVLAQVLMLVIKNFKSSEENVFALKKAFSAIQPITDAVTNTMQFLAKGIVNVVDGIGKLAKKLKLVKDEAVAEREDIANREIALTKKQREARVLDAKAMRDVSELRNKAIQVQYKDRNLQKKLLEEANALEKQMMDRKLAIATEEYEIAKIKAEWTGNDAETNEALADAEAHLYEVQKEYSDRTRRINSQIATADRALNTEKKENAQEQEEIVRRQIEFGEIEGNAKLQTEQLIADKSVEIDNRRLQQIIANNEAEKQAEKEKIEEKKKLALVYIQTLGSIFGAMAQIYEGDEKNANKNAGKIKALRIAEATMSTIAGAIDAYNSAQNLPAPANFIVGGANAAIVTATGIANIAKIKSTKLPNGGGGGYSAPSLGGAISSASATPSANLSALPPAVRTITGAKTEERLENFGNPQKVYILSSDLEANANKVEVRDNEITF